MYKSEPGASTHPLSFVFEESEVELLPIKHTLWIVHKGPCAMQPQDQQLMQSQQ